MSQINLIAHYGLGIAQFTQDPNRALIKPVEMALNMSLALLVVT
ncbi:MULTISPECIES: hypothetical protein [unclassified Colwellia]|nr:MULTISPECIES: hypothetical protein [unclassified Colwellia]